MSPEILALLPASTLLRLMEAKSFPIQAAEYKDAAEVVAGACEVADLDDLARAYWRCQPGSEVLIENEYFKRTGRLLWATNEETDTVAAMCGELWSRLKSPVV